MESSEVLYLYYISTGKGASQDILFNLLGYGILLSQIDVDGGNISDQKGKEVARAQRHF